MVDYRYSIYNSNRYQNNSKKSYINITRIIIYAAIIFFTVYLLSNMSCINDIKEDYQDDKLDSLVVKVKNVFSKYDKNADINRLSGIDKLIAELRLDDVIDGNHLTFDGHDESYTINKKRVHICMRDQNDGYYSDNMLMYVLLHELAHCKCKSIGHTPEFHEILDKIYEVARKTGLLDPNFTPNPSYCTHNKKS